MFIQASNLLKLPVAALDSQRKIGEVDKIVINPENGEIIGLLVKTGGFFKSFKLLSSQDIIDIDKNGAVTKNEENLLEIEEIIRAKKILEKKITVLGQRAITKSKKSLGKISDLLIDSETLAITKYYISSLFEERIIPADKVLKITKEAVVFSDDVIEETPVAEAEGAAA